MTYQDYAMANGHSMEEIEEMVGTLFGADAEMEEIMGTCSYAMGAGYNLNMDNSTYDTVDLMDGDDVLESWNLEY